MATISRLSVVVAARCAAGFDLAGLGVFAADVSAGDFFEAKVRPLLAANCYQVPRRKEAGIRPAARFAASRDEGRNGWPGDRAGQPDKSLLVQAIRYKGDTKMPPKKPLPAEAVETLGHLGQARRRHGPIRRPADAIAGAASIRNSIGRFSRCTSRRCRR